MDGLWAENYKFLKNDLLKVSVVDLIYRVYLRLGMQPHPLPELIKLCENNQKVWDVYKNACVMARLKFELNYFGKEYAPQRNLFEQYGIL